MTDCTHWLEPMLEAERREIAELAEENRRLRTLLSEIHSLSGGVDKPPGRMPGESLGDLYNRLSNPFELQRAEAEYRAQMEALKPASIHRWPFG